MRSVRYCVGLSLTFLRASLRYELSITFGWPLGCLWEWRTPQGCKMSRIVLFLLLFSVLKSLVICRSVTCKKSWQPKNGKILQEKAEKNHIREIHILFFFTVVILILTSSVLDFFFVKLKGHSFEIIFEVSHLILLIYRSISAGNSMIWIS